MPLTDTLKTAEELRDVGFTEEQSHLLAHKLEEAVSTQNQDLKTFFKAELLAMEGRLETRFESLRTELKQDIAELRNELKQDIAEVRNELKQDIADVRSELKQDIAEVRVEIAELRSELKQDSGEVRAQSSVGIAQLKAEFHSALREQLLRMVTITVALLSLAVAVIKLFPDLY